jgi:hypothetical protein
VSWYTSLANLLDYSTAGVKAELIKRLQAVLPALATTVGDENAPPAVNHAVTAVSGGAEVKEAAMYEPDSESAALVEAL